MRWFRFVLAKHLLGICISSPPAKWVFFLKSSLLTLLQITFYTTKTSKPLRHKNILKFQSLSHTKHPFFWGTRRGGPLFLLPGKTQDGNQRCALFHLSWEKVQESWTLSGLVGLVSPLRSSTSLMEWRFHAVLGHRFFLWRFEGVYPFPSHI